MNKKRAQTHSGFTLIEVLISMFLLVLISFSTYQATTQTFKLRESLSTEGEFYNNIRLAVGILQRDIENLYSPILIRPEIRRPDQSNPLIPSPAVAPNSAQQDLMKSRDVTRSDFFQNEYDQYSIRATRFIGKDNQLSFIASNHIRIYRDSAESDFKKVRYFLETEKDKEFETGSSTLFRSTSPDIFNDEESRDTKLKKYPLLHGIKKFKLRYYRKDKDQWSNSWDNELEDYKEIHPDLVELELEVKAPKTLSFEGRYQIRTEIPLYGIPSTF